MPSANQPIVSSVPLRDPAQSATSLCPTTFGRKRQLAQLEQLVGQLTEGRGSTVLVTGEAGVGKSRLVAEARSQASERGVRVLHGAAFELDRDLPYGPVADLLRAFLAGKSPDQIVDELGPARAPLARLLPGLATWLPEDAHGIAGQTRDQDQQLLQGLLVAFDRLVRGPTMMVVEDIHWSDEASLDLLLRLARSAASRALCLLVTLRTEDASPCVVVWRNAVDRQRLAIELPLRPLDRLDADAMVQCIAGGGLSPAVVQTIVGLTEGNPFFIEEVVRTTVLDGEARLRPEALRVPRSVHDAVQVRVDGLSAAARRAIQVAAVAGRHFEFDLLQLVLDAAERDLLPIVKELIAAQLVVENADERFAFRHALTRQAVYTDLLGRERRGLHAEVLLALERLAASRGNVPSEELSYHAHAAAAWTRAAKYARMAGGRALAMHAPRAAVEHFTRAAESDAHRGKPPDAEVLRGRAQAYHDLGQFDLARADYEGALAAASASGDKRLAWQLLVDLNQLWSGRDYALAGEYAERSLVAAHELDDAACIARSLDRVGNWHLNVGHVPQALAFQRRALAVLESTGDQRGVADTLNLLGMTSAFVDSEQSFAYYTRVIPMLRAFDDRQGLVTALVMRDLDTGFYWGDTFAAPSTTLDRAQVERDTDEAIRLARSIEWPAGESFARWEFALWFGIHGFYRRALELAHGGLQLAEGVEHTQWIAASLCSLGALYLDVAAPQRAQPLLERALTLGHEVGSQVWAPYAAALLVTAAAREGDFPTASAILQREMGDDTPFETATQRQLWCARAEFLLTSGSAAEALAIGEKLAGTVSAGKVVPRVWILRANALLALRSLDEAERIIADAVDTSIARGLRSLTWRAHAGYARLLRARGRRDEADAQLRLAHAMVQELASEIDEQVLQAAFVAWAFSSMPRTGAVSERRVSKQASGGLTRREREVAALIGQGYSNRAIADDLVIGERTVESYVSAILAKLGFGARTQIAAWAVTHRDPPPSSKSPY